MSILPLNWWKIISRNIGIDIKFYIFVGLMKRYKVRQIIRFLERDGLK